MDQDQIERALQRAREAKKELEEKRDRGAWMVSAELAALRLASDIEALVSDLQEVTRDRDRLKHREQDIIKATDPADGGQYRADIAGAIMRQRRELDAARKDLQEAREEIERLRKLIPQIVDAARRRGTIADGALGSWGQMHRERLADLLRQAGVDPDAPRQVL